MVRKLWDKVTGMCARAKGICGIVPALAFALVVSVFGQGAMAAETTIPEMPVDFADIASKGAVVMGTVISAVVGIFVLSALVRMGIRWISRAFSA